MHEKAEIIVDAKRGQVSICCNDDEAFWNLWKAVNQAAGPVEVPEALSMVAILRKPRPMRAIWPPFLVLGCCGLVLFVFAMIFSIGIGTIAGWIK